MSQINFDRIPGLIAVYRITDSQMTKVYGKDVGVDLNKLRDMIMENMRIGEEEAEKLKLIQPFLGFSMIVDDMGLTYINGYVVFTQAKKTNWTLLIKTLLREVGVYERS